MSLVSAWIEPVTYPSHLADRFPDQRMHTSMENPPGASRASRKVQVVPSEKVIRFTFVIAWLRSRIRGSREKR